MTDFYLGKPTALVALPEPDPPLQPSGQRPSTIHVAAGGGRTVDLARRSLRTFPISWRLLDADTFTILEEFFTGGRGPGPFVLLDPARRNHLSANQSAATSQFNDPSGFSVAAGSGEALSSQVIRWLRGPRSLRWTLPPTVSSGVLELDPPNGLAGFPVPAGQPWTFSGVVSLGGILSSVTLTPVLSWRSEGGAEVALTSGTPVAAVPGAWTSWSVSLSTPPAGALYLRPQLRVTPGVLTAAGLQTDYGYAGISRPVRPGNVALSGPGRSLVTMPPPLRLGGFTVVAAAPALPVELLLDKLQLDLFNGVRPWVMGTGIPLVSMTALTETYQILPRRDCTATFVEIS